MAVTFMRHRCVSLKNFSFFALPPRVLSALLTVLLPAMLAAPCLAQATLEQGYDAIERGNVAEAIWRDLAGQGNTTAQVNLGQLYRMGKGVAQDDREAVKWYSLAAKNGSETAR